MFCLLSRGVPFSRLTTNWFCVGKVPFAKSNFEHSMKSASAGQLKTLGTQMGCLIGVPIWVLQKHKSIRITGNIVKVINN